MIASLTAHGWRLELLPEAGGSVAALKRGDRDILRPAPAGARDPLTTACFPLVPYANRIANGRFDFNGREIVLDVLDRFAPHALHGQGWLMPWQVEAQETDAITLLCRHAAGAWPWDWTARQRFTLGEDGLNAELELTNESAGIMPAGLGFHPYFAAGPESVLEFEAKAVWLTGRDPVPVGRAAPEVLADWSAGARIADRPPVDHCYEGWPGQARMVAPGGNGVTVEASENVRFLHVFTPAGADHACLEPVTHRPDAVHGAAGEMPVLGPGETVSLRMTIRAGQS